MSTTAANPAAGAEQELTDGFNLIIDALKLNGLDTIYGVPGIPITDFGRMAQAAGIRVIHQDAPLVPAFDTVENCYLGREYPRRRGVIDRAAMRVHIAEVARDIAPRFGAVVAVPAPSCFHPVYCSPRLVTP